ncbi:hypothetical protein RJ639_028463 [Escallonia herrerae]|uniref:Retrotransposon gag domain-containing protein n=1 Tax=Escallonia herrerae TaxID=1293975 RepID=A0AA89BHG7_9ASTE|nr:hypothetical protein RJ639_028463 [Escallonia herrerae]
MSWAFEKLTKSVEEKDFQIVTLMNKLELQTSDESNRGEVNEASKKGGANGRHDGSTFDGFEKEDMSNSVASLSVQQLQDMITSTIREQYGGPYRNNLMYSKLYTKQIDNMRMPAGAGTEGDLLVKQFVRYLRGNAFDWYIDIEPESFNYWEVMERTEGDLLVKQFVRSLRGNAFDWYIDIEPESIDYWEAMEREFLNRFYSTRRSVSMMELKNTRQWKDEPMGNRLTNFEELATRAHDMEISIANHGGNSPALPDPRKDKKEGKKVEWPIFINAHLDLEEEERYFELPKEFNDVFAWTYKEIHGLDPKVAVHHLAVKSGVCPVKQAQRTFYPKVVLEIEVEINKLIEAHFIREVNAIGWGRRRSSLRLTAATGKDKVNIPICQQWVLPELLDCRIEETDVISVRGVEAEDWRQPLINYLEHGRLPDDIRDKTKIRRRALRFIYYKDTLFRRSYEGLFLRCLGEDEATQAKDEAYSGVCGAHQSVLKLHFQIKRMGYYWPTMVKD